MVRRYAGTGIVLGIRLIRMVHSRMANNQTRRNFLSVAPIATLATVPFVEKLLFATLATPGEAPVESSEGFQLFTAEKLAGLIKSFHTDLGEHYLYQPATLPLTIAISTQGAKPAGEFEFHETRDHIFLILEGATKFDLGGAPKNPRITRPGEWLALTSDGATTIEVKKGDMLIVPRGIPHRQSTEQSVTWMLISPSGAKKD
jgi:mannose-6-phosphate isomerase-like protein (cupin superfamily)